MNKPSTLSIVLSSLVLCGTTQAQTVLLEETFTGGMFTTGFTTEAGPISDCDWVFAPDAIDSVTFNQDYTDTVPNGGNFDEYFVFIDSDACTGTTSNTVDAFLVSPPFDASGGGMLTLTFDHQFRDFTGSIATVEVYNGTTWTEVAQWEDNVGYPNPPVQESFDITAGAGGSAVAQVRFNYFATWDWWWAIDNIRVTANVVGLDEGHAQHALRMYPNPTSDVLNIRLDGYDAYAVTLLDATGRIVLEQRLMGPLDVSALNNGMYTAMIRDRHGDRIARAPFVKH
ncbi:MAG TPA: T9SS type A sorting domain-containing protein [Flavobacteriales bacterium]|nr:T9SS type A sorting domain-containing protein [Flavobacteriales bacterium]